MSRASALPGSVETSAFVARLQQAVSGGVRFDVFTRGRYATDASFYQIMPLGVVVPRTTDEALRRWLSRATRVYRSRRAAAAPRNAARPSTAA